jgi:hypothetical protein
MGCETSSSANVTSSEKVNDVEFYENQRIVLNKKTGEAGGELKEKPEEDFFEAVAAEGESFMAVCPWKGQIEEPEAHNPVVISKPEVEYEIDWVYGYKCQSARQNVFLASSGIVYPAAALCVMTKGEKQGYFGGGEAANEHRNAKNNLTSHNDDVTCLAMSPDRKFCVSGQRGPSPTLFAWGCEFDDYDEDAVIDTRGKMIKRFQLARGARGIAACTISSDGKYTACVDMSNDHNVWVFNIETGAQEFKMKGDSNYIYDIAFTKKEGSHLLMTSGKNHLYFWDFKKNEKKRGIAGDHGILSHQVCCWDKEGVAYSGSADGRIFVWNDNKCTEDVKAHEGYISAIHATDDGKVISAGKDGGVKFFNTPKMDLEQSFDEGSIVNTHAIAIDYDDKRLVIGCRNGDIIDYCSYDAEPAGCVVVSSHDNGEVWGLAPGIGGTFVTSGDDNKVMTWNMSDDHKATSKVKVSTETRNSKKGKASTISHLPAS